MKSINIAISCAGSGIAQSVIDSCKLSHLPLRLFGLDCNPMAFGLYDCDEQILVPKITSESYVENIIAVCKAHSIHLIIPGTDDEVQLFSQHEKDFLDKNIKVIVAEASFLDLVRDKVNANNVLSAYSDIFVKGYYTIEDFKKDLKQGKVNYPVIAKPNSGSGSLGVFIINNEEDLSKVTSKHSIQELAMPNKQDENHKNFIEAVNSGRNLQASEFSIHIVTNKEGDLIGKMVSKNRLKLGVPVEIVPVQSEEIWYEIDKLIPVFKSMGLKGPLNIQGRMTDNGLKIFEMNARFTGITGLRSQMGFNEVDACIRSWLDIGDSDIALQCNTNVIGLRQTLNKVVTKDKSLLEFNTTSEKHLLLTGATGYLGRNLIDTLLESRAPYKIWALVRDKKRAKLVLPNAIVLYDEQDVLSGKLSLGLVDTLLHLGFARPHKSNVEIAESLEFTARLFRNAVDNNIPNIINISSQSVYGQANLPPWTESTPVSPNSPYATAKYTSEVILNELTIQSKQINATSIRMAGLTGGQKGLVNVDLVSRFVKQIKNAEDLNLVGGTQIIERLDVRDAVSGLIALLNTESKKWKSIYNLGSGNTITLLELSKKIIHIGKHQYNLNGVKLNLEKKDVDMKFGMDISQIKTDADWSPKYSIDDIICSLFEFDY